MKKIQLCMSFFVLFGILSCDDEIDINHPIIATWSQIGQGYYDTAGNLVVDSVSCSSCYTVFRPDGKRVINDTDYHVDFKIIDDKIYLNYKDKNNTLIYRYELSNDNNQLLTRYISEDPSFVYPDYYVVLYKRIK